MDVLGYKQGDVYFSLTIVHDKFHISQHLNETVDKVRRQEDKALLERGDGRLKGSRFSWLANEENVNEEFVERSNVSAK